MRQLIDLTGKKFGHLTVIERVENYISPSGVSIPKWRCQCDCGNIVEIVSSSLRYGKTKSCGCLQKEITKGKCLDNLIGKTFDKLTVIDRAENKSGKTYWKCKCDCGNIVIIDAYRLKSGKAKSCGCINKELMSKKFLKNLIGQRFGRLVVIERADDYIIPSNKKHTTRWLCQCDCGNTTYVTGSNLKNGKIISCGCYKKEKISQKFTKDITGQKFGKLTVIERVENKKGRVCWKCLCECGQEVIVSSNSLVRQKTMSCGCLSSFGEYNIKQYFINNKIKFESQKRFDDLLGLGNGLLSYDFYIPQYNLLIEAQGQQHIAPKKLFGGEEQFQKQKEHDKRKREYAKKNGYRLLEIWYYDYNNVNTILDNYLKNISQPDCEGKNISC